nr:kininogen-1 [Anolis sagrei ordinatus]
MELFVLLVLTFCCCQAVPLEGEDADCNSPDVFSAVDLAVKAHNEDQKDGNLFALRVILAARRTAGPGNNFLIKYQLAETSCPLKGSVSWQNCEFLPPSEGDSGECTAEIHSDDSQVFSSVFQTCRITTAPGKVTRSHARCLGCWHTISSKSEELIPILRHAISLFNNESDQQPLFDAVGVVHAARQVVAGWKYRFEYWIQETNCSKVDFANMAPSETCKILPKGHVGSCHVESYVDFRNTIVNVEQKCELEVDTKKNCPGCTRVIPSDSPQLKEPLAAVAEKYNTECSDGFLYRITKVTKATVQIVSGIMYRIEFQIIETNCSNAEVHGLDENCIAKENSEPLHCYSSVWEKPWQPKSEVAVTFKCTEKAFNTALLRRPPGFTPFRSAGVVTEENTQVCGHGHKKTKPKSSEDLQEDANEHSESLHIPSTANPLEQEDTTARSPGEESVGFPSQDSIIPSLSLFERLPDLPEPPAPKCPGKPWKPIILSPTSLPDPGDLVLEDLLPSEGDVAEPEEIAAVAIQPVAADFDLADALN